MSIGDDSQEFEDAEDPDSKDKADDDLAVSRPQLVSGVTTWSLSTPQSHDLFFIFNWSYSSQEGLIKIFYFLGFIFRGK